MWINHLSQLAVIIVVLILSQVLPSAQDPGIWKAKLLMFYYDQGLYDLANKMTQHHQFNLNFS
jgi:hypothetical protein